MNILEKIYEGTVIRPPSEAGSLILQVTLGCSDNKCVFCPAYKHKSFRIKETRRIEGELRLLSSVYPGVRKVFLADGDALAMEQENLKEILALVAGHFPALTRVGAYGSVKSLQNKTEKDLSELKDLKLGIVYLGFETGDDEVYRFTRKYGSPAGNVATCLKVKAAGIKTNVTVIAGLGGKKLSANHAVNTAKILNLSRPDQIAVLTLMIEPGTPLYEIREKGEFRELDAMGIISETKALVENMEDFRCQFFSNHASNYYPIAARFPKDKPGVLNRLGNILKNREENLLTPDYMRGL